MQDYDNYDIHRQRLMSHTVQTHTQSFRENSILLQSKRSYTLQNYRHLFKRFSLPYISQASSVTLLACRYICQNNVFHILYYIIMRTVSVSYYSSGQHLARLRDSALARQTHPVFGLQDVENAWLHAHILVQFRRNGLGHVIMWLVAFSWCEW